MRIYYDTDIVLTLMSDFQNLEKLPPDSDQQQAAIMAIKDEDGYNWG